MPVVTDKWYTPEVESKLNTLTYQAITDSMYNPVAYRVWLGIEQIGTVWREKSGNKGNNRHNWTWRNSLHENTQRFNTRKNAASELLFVYIETFGRIN